MSHALPLDMMLLDMNFHTKPGWTGYSFDRNLFPFPATTMAQLKSRGLRLAVNLHDADGVAATEDSHAAMVTALGLDPATNTTIPFSVCNSSAVSFALEDTVIARLQRQGVDLTWVDWQQGGQKGGCAGDDHNPRLGISHLRVTSRERRSETARPAVLARWGGLGSHRYPVGFSGDVAGLTWANLAFQPFFSFTASNVMYAWSHDLLGPANDPELTVRWLQFGALSSIFRLHDRGLSAGECVRDAFPTPPDVRSGCGLVDVWRLPAQHLAAARVAMQGRAALVPYLYSAMRETFDSGVQVSG